jgi:tRNA(Ile)-lysidine synthase
MYTHFVNYIEKHQLFDPKEKILLAVSGGIDSMVMAHLFYRNGAAIGIAHCNFNLRDEESDGDELFVKEWAAARQIIFHCERFDTKNYASKHKLSTQMAARELRYEWFKHIIKAFGYQKIAIAHHADDNIETVLINLTRGTGLKGICGIAPRNGNIIRPLLFATREEIVGYAGENHILFREDHTNASTDYARNRIRHQVVPQLKLLNPSLAETFLHNSDHFSQAYKALNETLTHDQKKWCTQHLHEWHINIPELHKSKMPELFLFEFLQHFGFNSTQITDIYKSLDKQSGKRFFSEKHGLLKDRDVLIVFPKDDKKEILPIEIHQDDITIDYPGSLNIEYLKNNSQFNIPAGRHVECFDADTLHFPLILRSWQHGDTFIPLGMKGRKKVSDFFIDNKLPAHIKEQQLVLVSGDDIIWLVGHRIDDRYKLTPQTRTICKITWNVNQPG